MWLRSGPGETEQTTAHRGVTQRTGCNGVGSDEFSCREPVTLLKEPRRRLTCVVSVDRDSEVFAAGARSWRAGFDDREDLRDEPTPTPALSARRSLAPADCGAPGSLRLRLGGDFSRGQEEPKRGDQQLRVVPGE